MFRKLFGRSKPKTTTNSRPQLTQTLSASILRVVGTQSITSMPRSAQKAFQVSTDPSAEAKDFVEVLESDEALSAKVLKVANSVYYDRGSGSETLIDAVAAIGTRDLKDLLSASILSDVFASNHPLRVAFWEHDIAVAIAARELAQKVAPDSTDTAFVAGLMHDIGKLLLLSKAPSEYEKVIQSVKAGNSFCRAEEEMFPFNHTEVGLLIANKWSFSDELAVSIRFHHESWEHTVPKSLQGIVKSANLIIHALGIGISEKISYLHQAAREELPAAYSWLNITEADGKALMKNIRKRYAEDNELFHLGTSI